MLTIVTPSHCSLDGLKSLAVEVLPHLSARTIWHIKDSGACADTATWAANVLALHVAFVEFNNVPDAGIYDALNQAVAAVQTPYYLVVGSDDHVRGEVVATLADSLASLPESGLSDIITFPVETPAGVRRRRRFWPLWLSSSGLMASHSVGTLIRRRLHDTLGPYDVRYRILADSLFIRRARLACANFDHRDGPILGSFSLDGISSRDHGRRLVETYSYLASTGSSRWLQSAILWLRLMRYRPTSLL